MTWLGQCVMFSRKTLNSNSGSHHPGVWMGTNNFSGKTDEMLGGLTLIWTGVPSTGQGNVEWVNLARN